MTLSSTPTTNGKMGKKRPRKKNELSQWHKSIFGPQVSMCGSRGNGM